MNVSLTPSFRLPPPPPLSLGSFSHSPFFLCSNLLSVCPALEECATSLYESKRLSIFYNAEEPFLFLFFLSRRMNPLWYITCGIVCTGKHSRRFFWILRRDGLGTTSIGRDDKKAHDYAKSKEDKRRFPLAVQPQQCMGLQVNVSKRVCFLFFSNPLYCCS
jgi:hypothetical protein